jgi:hypothetical protein
MDADRLGAREVSARWRSDRDRFWCLRVDLKGQRCEGNDDFHCWSLVVYDYFKVIFLLFL